MLNKNKELRTEMAFALGGLAGNNAHGAGFLQAALEMGAQPGIISCTSGQIRWVHRYLQVLQHREQGEGHEDLHALFEQELASINKTGEINTDVALLGMFGKENVFRPAYGQVFSDFWRNAGESLLSFRQPGSRGLLAHRMLSMIPGRSLVPDASEAYYARVAADFSSADVGICFNAYSPCEGVEYVYLNAAARALLHDPATPDKYAPEHPSQRHQRRIYRNISAAGVRDALWLYQYGFYDQDQDCVDGVYFRNIMLAELVAADTIFVVRPINHRWQGALPRSYPGVEDLKTKVGMNGAYAGERDQITLINKLLARNCLDVQGGRGYHHVELVELEIALQRGYFDYMLESREVFEQARAMALARFQGLEQGAPESAPVRANVSTCHAALS
jgi:hypothetical protein